MRVEGVHGFIESLVPLHLDRSSRPMTEKLSGLTVRQRVTAAILGGVVGVSACVAAKKVDIPFSPTPIVTPPVELGPNLQPISPDLEIFGGFMIGESGIGPISGLKMVSDPDPEFVEEVENRFTEYVPGTTAENTKVHVYDMIGEKGTAPFVIVSETENEKAMRSYVAFWVDEDGVQKPPFNGEVYVFYPLGVYTQPDGKKLVGVISLNEDKLLRPELFTIDGQEVRFIPPYTDSVGVEVAPTQPSAFINEISYREASATVVPQNPIEAVGATAVPTSETTPIVTPTPESAVTPVEKQKITAKIGDVVAIFDTAYIARSYNRIWDGHQYGPDYDNRYVYLVLEGKYTGQASSHFYEGSEYLNGDTMYLEGNDWPDYGFIAGWKDKTLQIAFVIRSGDKGPYIFHNEIDGWEFDITPLISEQEIEQKTNEGIQ